MKKLLGALFALVFACAAVAPVSAQVGEPQAQTVVSGGVYTTLASAVAASTNQSWTSINLGRPKVVTVCLSASGATTFTVTESIDGTSFFVATLANTATDSKYAPASAGTLCENIAPAAYVKVSTSAAVTVTAQIQASY
jgi:hypothetical protein